MGSWSKAFLAASGSLISWKTHAVETDRGSSSVRRFRTDTGTVLVSVMCCFVTMPRTTKSRMTTTTTTTRTSTRTRISNYPDDADVDEDDSISSNKDNAT